MGPRIALTQDIKEGITGLLKPSVDQVRVLVLLFPELLSPEHV